MARKLTLSGLLLVCLGAANAGKLRATATAKARTHMRMGVRQVPVSIPLRIPMMVRDDEPQDDPLPVDLGRVLLGGSPPEGQDDGPVVLTLGPEEGVRPVAEAGDAGPRNLLDVLRALGAAQAVHGASPAAFPLAADGLKIKMRPGDGVPTPLALEEEGGAVRIAGGLPPHLNASSLRVKQLGRLIAVQYMVGDGQNLVGVEQRFMLDFEPQESAQVNYSGATGAFSLELHRPKDSGLPQDVTIDFEDQEPETTQEAAKNTTASLTRESASENGSKEQENAVESKQQVVINEADEANEKVKEPKAPAVKHTPDGEESQPKVADLDREVPPKKVLVKARKLDGTAVVVEKNVELEPEETPNIAANKSYTIAEKVFSARGKADLEAAARRPQSQMPTLKLGDDVDTKIQTVLQSASDEDAKLQDLKTEIEQLKAGLKDPAFVPPTIPEIPKTASKVGEVKAESSRKESMSAPKVVPDIKMVKVPEADGMNKVVMPASEATLKMEQATMHMQQALSPLPEPMILIEVDNF